MIFAMVYTSCEEDIGEVYEPTANNDEVVNLEDSLIDDDVNNGEGVSFWDGFLILVRRRRGGQRFIRSTGRAGLCRPTHSQAAGRDSSSMAFARWGA